MNNDRIYLKILDKLSIFMFKLNEKKPTVQKNTYINK